MSPVVQGPTGNARLDRINGMESRIAELETELAKVKDEASDLVDAGDALGRWMIEASPLEVMSEANRLMALHDFWRSCPARSSHRRWKR